MPVLPASSSVPVAAAAMRRGEVVVLPTDTVYGVAVDPTRPGATDRLFALKRRPRDVPLPVLVASPDQLPEVAEVPAGVADAVGGLWPGGLTVVLRRRPGWEADLGDEGGTVGVRCPDHPVPRELAGIVGPIAATSANLHGMDTPPTAAAVAAQLELPPDVVVLDGGPCGGVPSTVVDLSGAEPRLLREGEVPWSVIRAALPVL